MDSSSSGPDLEARLRDALAPRYVLLRPIGKGGMGAVFLAREPELSRVVAVKVLAPELAKDETARARFIREAQAAASIAHPNVIAIHSVGALDDGTPYFVMQYATGESIGARLAREGPVSTTEATRMIGELASALAAAHARGIVHRDIKPANVLYDQETGRILITDFGIAAVRAMPGGDVVPQLTGTGMMLGTPRYMSPEQLTAEPANDRTDVYGLGLVAYELLTGAGPFDTTSPMRLMAAHLGEVPRRLSLLRPDVDPDFDELVFACLAKDASARPSAADIVRRLGAAEVILEWPAPGLAQLQSALTPVTRLFIAGGVITAGAFLTLFGSGSNLAAQRLSLMMVLLLLATTTGVALLGAASWRLWRLTTQVTRAIGLGYGWTTIAETVADSRRDTGLLIAGLREYSSLSVEARDAMRRRRVLAALISLGSGVVTLPLLIAFAWIASSAPQLWIATLIMVGPTLALLTWSGALRRREVRRLRSARARFTNRRTVDDATDSLVEAWLRTFNVARAGQRLATGPTEHRAAARALGLFVALGTLVTVICLVPIVYIGVAGASYWPRMQGVAGATIKTTVAETARPLALPRDSSIPPLDAGRAFRLLWAPAGPLPSTDSEGFAEQPAIGLPDLLPTPYPPTLFARLVRGPDGKLVDVRNGQVAGGPGPVGLLEYARGGFSPEERRWLEQLDASPRWKLWTQYARSTRADLLGARFVIPFTDTLSHLALPIAKFGVIKAMAYQSVARAALYRSRGEMARADSLLRETISVGLRMTEDGSILIDQLMGDVLVAIGHTALHDAAVLDGRAAGKEWQARMNLATVAQGEQSDSLGPTGAAELDARAMRRRIIATVLSTHLQNGTRDEYYMALAMSPCTNVRELVAGRDEDARDALKRAQRTLGRFPSELAFLDMIERQPMIVVHDPGDSRAKRLMMPIARLSGWVFRNPRIPGCVSTLMSLQ